MRDQRVLVAGGAGFINSNLANHLAEDNDVITVDDTYLGTPENVAENVEFVEASVLDDDLPADADVLFHLAALSSWNIHEENSRRSCRVNVEGFVNTVEQVKEQGLYHRRLRLDILYLRAGPNPCRRVWKSNPRQPTRP